ncbi:hypothetical protein OHZ10_36040 [Burkholderia arboris]|uniref:Uncharacterized protein n=1 Tax=Burkholderia arboris TaxID=488730 RepID=A0ABZ3DWU3_9BURK
MPIDVPESHNWTALSEREQHCLLTLNGQIAQAEQWIYQRSQELVMAYGVATAQARHADDGKLGEDVELIATMLFLPREDHADHLSVNSSIVARIDIPILPVPQTHAKPSHVDQRVISHFLEPRSKWNQIFLTLFDDALQGDMAKLLSISGLCTNIAFIQQNLCQW